MKARISPAAVAAGLILTAALGAALFRSQPMSTQRGINSFDSVRAPEFPAGFTWYNTKEPLSLRALRGKLVLLDFWTYGCINCMHILPDLKRLEEKYPKNLVVISVHSAKFSNESEAKNIRNALLRYNIEHPVLVDQKMRVWDEYAVRSWPTFVLIGPDGRVIGQTSGEGNYDVLDRAIATSLEESRPKGILNETPLKLALERAKVPATPLWYPGKIAINAGGQLAISDSNHNRVVFANHLDGKIEAVAGSGVAGFKDGDLATAQFNNPLGLAFNPEDNTWYVADTNNHAIRAINLNTKKVSTIAGTGQQAEWGAKGGTGTQAALSSPWDLYLNRHTLYIAMAGPHQIWQMDLTDGKVSVFAGSGIEARKDGTRQTAAFAQPSGLASDGKHLFVADSESSSIRSVDLPETGDQVTTLAGGDLFDFGDKDGQGLSVRLQHPLGLAYHDGTLYLADTYNSKIKRLDPKTGVVKTIHSGGLYEPGGLAFDASTGTLFIADTNNNTLRRLNLKENKLAAVSLTGLQPPVQRVETAAQPAAAKTAAAKQQLAPNGKGELVLDIGLPDGFKLNYDAPLKFEAKVQGSGLRLAKNSITGKAFQLPVRVPLATEGNGAGTVELTAFVSYCSHGKGGVCKVERVTRSVPFEVKAGGSSGLKVDGGELP